MELVEKGTTGHGGSMLARKSQSLIKGMDAVEHDMPRSKVVWVNVIASRCSSKL